MPTLRRIFQSGHASVDRPYIDKKIYLYATSILHTLLADLEKRRYARQISETSVASPPVFILGHWRNGTTFLHNLMCQDTRFTYMRAYQALFPECFLLSPLSQIVSRTHHLVPIKTRPMDNVKFGMLEPWEDEFIMAAATGISPYIRALFPRTLGPESGYRYPDFVDTKEITLWKAVFVRLMKRLTILENKTVLLKSPPHTARIKILLELFPQSKFIHIVRHPLAVFASNIKLWSSALSLAFLQEVGSREIMEIVLSTYVHMYAAYHEQKALIPEANLVEITYEDLEKNPVSELRSVYERLDLPYSPDFETNLKHYLATLSTYKKNSFDLSTNVQNMVRNRWADTFDRYGY
ncbi:MAG: sulfotransferase [Desulfatirhabdiaceae bacterium]